MASPAMAVSTVKAKSKALLFVAEIILATFALAIAAGVAVLLWCNPNLMAY